MFEEPEASAIILVRSIGLKKYLGVFVHYEYLLVWTKVM